MRLTRIYTRTGDDGTTRLAHGEQVAKNCSRVAAYGTVDELNAQLGVAATIELCPVLQRAVLHLQNQLFDLGADVATPREVSVEFEVPRIENTHVAELERLIDRLNAELQPLENFVLPGGSAGAAALHVARTVCRRAERDLMLLAAEADVGAALAYLNRLSDALFVMARFENQASSTPEPLWQPGDGCGWGDDSGGAGEGSGTN